MLRRPRRSRLEAWTAGALTRRTLVAAAACALIAPAAHARSSAEHRERQPNYFDDEAGYRTERYRAPVPDDVPGAVRVSAGQVRDMMAKGALAIDVFGVANTRYDEFDGAWVVAKQRVSVPGATWLPEVGKGGPPREILVYFEQNLETLTRGDKTCPLIFFCIADCWMSWNAAQRATAMGYTNVHWFAEGTDGWLDEGWDLEAVDPVAVGVE
jgi:PQQ-dependent catabolism-associated CXXCW motif protein